MLALVAAVGAVALFVSLAAAVRRDRLRGTVVAVVLGLHCFAWSPLVPQVVCDAVVVASLVLLLMAAASPRADAPAMHGGPASSLIVVLFASACLVTVVAYPPGFGLVFRMTLLVLLVVVVLGRGGAADRRRVVDGVVVVAVLQSLAGIVEFVRGEPLLWGYKVYTTGRGLWNENHLLGGEVARVQGTMSHALPYGTLLMVALVLLLCTWHRRAVAARWSALALFSTMVVASGSRSALIGIVLALTYLLVSSRRAATWQRGSVLAATGAAAVLTSWSTVASTVDQLLQSGSYENRAGHLFAVPRLIGRPALEAFFGSGESSEQRLFAQGYFYGTGFNVVDNQLLSSLATQGVLGAGLVISVFVVAARHGGRDVRASLIVLTSALMTFEFFKMTSMVLLFTVVVCLAGSPRDPDGPGDTLAETPRGTGVPSSTDPVATVPVSSVPVSSVPVSSGPVSPGRRGLAADRPVDVPGSPDDTSGPRRRGRRAASPH